MQAPEYLIENIDLIIGKLARLSRVFKQLPKEIRVSKEAKDVFITRMKHFQCHDPNPLKPLTLFTVPIVLQPGIGKFLFVVVWLDYGKMLRRRDKKF